MAYKKSNPNGQATMANSEPIVIASDQTAVPVSGTITANIGTVATLATAAKQDTGNTSVASIDTKFPAQGQALAAASLPVVLTAAQVTTLTPPAAITGFNLEATQTAMSAKLPATLGQKAMAASLAVVLASDQTSIPVTMTSTTITGSVAVTNAGVFVVQENGAALTALQLIDDTVFTDDTSTHTTAVTKGLGIMAVANPTDAAVDANDIGMVAMTLARAMKNDITTIAGTAPTTAGFIDIKGADGNVFVRQATGSNLHTVLDSGTLTTVSTVTNLSQLGGAAVPIGAGLEATAIRVTLPTDGTGVVKLGAGVAEIGNVKNSGTFAVQATPVTQANTFMLGGVNIKEINAVTPLMGNGITGTGSQRVTIASDNTAFSVNATLSAETTKVIGTVNQGTSPWVTSNATTSVVGNGAAATAQRVTLANDSTGIVALTTSTASIGKLAANSGVTIGAVEIAAAQTLATVTTVASVTQNPDIRQATASNLNAQVVGNIAHDGVDSGNPVLSGYRAIAHGTNPTAVAAADRTVGYSNIAGIPFFIGGHPNIVAKEFTVLAADGAQTNLALVSVAAGTKIIVTKIGVFSSKATTVNVGVRVGFGTATIPAAALAGATGIVLTHSGISPGSGVVEGNGSGIIGIGADDEDLRITSDSPTTGSIRVLVNYYTIAS